MTATPAQNNNLETEYESLYRRNIYWFFDALEEMLDLGPDAENQTPSLISKEN